MKALKVTSIALAAITLIVAISSVAAADEGESITITIDRKTMPQSVFHPGRAKTDPATLTIHDYVIRNYYGVPIRGFTVQTSAGSTEIPIDSVQEIKFKGWIHRKTKDIYLVENVVNADFILTDGRELTALTNADFGTIEGRTERGEFFLKDPHTVKHLVFNRSEPAPEPVKPEPAPVKVDAPVIPGDSDGDGVPDSRDKCPDTPRGVAVDENGCPPDSDGDGVPDYKDECPNTPTGARVNAVGCWSLKGVNFDYNKWDIKPEYHSLLDENVRVLQMNPSMKVEIQGHTDSIGSQEYNLPLSENRAESAKAYFVSKGISADRIETRGFGKLKPIASNETDEGRAQNRRTDIRVISR